MNSVLASAKRLVVKVGSSLVTNRGQGLDHAALTRWAGQVAELRRMGREVVLVSSGAIAEGMQRLGWKRRPHALHELQAAAAVGQMGVIQAYESCFRGHDLKSSQVLLTHEDLADRKRYLNARSTLRTLLALGVIPIINENDTVATDEIRFGDNDTLAALVTNLVEADALVILTDVAGLYDIPPNQQKGGKPPDPAQAARFIEEVYDIDREARPVAGGSTSGPGTGGMSSKVEAARVAGRFGVVTVVASGRRERPVTSLLEGAGEGTVFWPSVSRLQSRKHWIAYALRPAGELVVDAGARKALVEGKKSLLPSGVKAVRGRFGAGDAVSVVDEAGQEFARGLCTFDAAEVELIAGRKTADLEGILGYRPAPEVIHRDDLVLL